MSLQGRKVAILATDGFEQVELTEPRRVLIEAGASVEIVSPNLGAIQGFKHLEKGMVVRVDRKLSDAREEDYDALVLPGGVINPDKLRTDKKAIAFVRDFVNAEKPVAAICHAPWIFIDADVAGGRTMTAVKSVRADLENAGANVVDEDVAVDGHIITSRGPSDLPAFCQRLVDMLEDIHTPSKPGTFAFI